MRVDIKIEPELREDYAVLHVQKVTPEVVELSKTLETAGDQPQLIVAKKEGKSYVIEPDSIEIIRTEGGVVTLYGVDAAGFSIDKPLYELESRLGADFVRISKSTIINIYRADHVVPSLNGTMDIVMKNGMEDFISRKYLGAFKKRLGL